MHEDGRERTRVLDQITPVAEAAGELWLCGNTHLLLMQPLRSMSKQAIQLWFDTEEPVYG